MIGLLLSALALQSAQVDSLMAAGRALFAQRVIGRYAALEDFRAAARLAPTDAEPWYWQMKVGFYLRSEDGDYIAREALLGLFAATPDYNDAWARFRDVYHDVKIWRRAERALAKHGEQPAALEHRAELLIALGDGRRADSLLAVATTHAPVTAATCLLRAEANFLAGRRQAGFAWHDSALARADDDSTDALWGEAWLIASPDEVTRHTLTPRGYRRVFYKRFWQQRDPNLLTPENERLEEHYARQAEARRTYRLSHPQRSTYYSRCARALKYYEDRQELKALAEQGAVSVSSRVATLPVEALQDTALPLAARAGLTAQGLIYLRHGAPDRRANCVTDLARSGFALPRCSSFLDAESWMYFTPDGPLNIPFGKGEYFQPVTTEQVRNARVLMHTDRTTLPAPLITHAWSAYFKSAAAGLTDAYYKARGDSAAIVLWDANGTPTRATGRGLLQLTVPPGGYDLGLDVDSAGVLGRIRRDVTVQWFSPLRLELSSLALAPIDRNTPLPDRETTLRGMPADLSYPAGTPLAAYMEIYGLATDPTSRSRYHLRYSFEPVRSVFARLFGGTARPIVFEFDRDAIGATATQQLVIEPDRLPPGRYRVTVAVTDLSRNVKSESVALEIAIR
ncbi:MAG: hypothetical protein AUH75_02110 [Gemmatimonadetes bacterium 13_1_40CM_4_65_7]|nr:MAG: hypothetical protein AUH75_02110 [Gemmatimonadetes bacterium 13_1_40CM_4_65_7]